MKKHRTREEAVAAAVKSTLFLKPEEICLVVHRLDWRPTEGPDAGYSDDYFLRVTVEIDGRKQNVFLNAGGCHYCTREEREKP